MRTKSTKAALAAVARHEAMVAYIKDNLRVKRTVPLENQADWIRDTSEDVFKARATGHTVAVQELLFSERCYFGFQYNPGCVKEDEHWDICFITRK